MSLRAKDLASKIICCGVGSIVSIQSFINICVATGLAPNTGTPLPFVSYGLTSLISLFMGMGLVLNVGLQSSAYNKELQEKRSEIGYLLSERGILMTRKEPVKKSYTFWQSFQRSGFPGCTYSFQGDKKNFHAV